MSEGKLYKVMATFEVMVLAENKEKAEEIAKNCLEGDGEEKVRTCITERAFFINDVPVDWHDTSPWEEENGEKDLNPDCRTVKEIIDAENKALT